MKAYNKPATSKLLVRFDNELKQLLMEDLKVFRAKNFRRNNKRPPDQYIHLPIKFFLSIL
jgi:hypothetical protein